MIVTVYVFGYIGGNHINPAVTFGLAATGKFPWSEVPAYVAAQVAGAVAGAFTIVGVLGTKAQRHRPRRRVVRRLRSPGTRRSSPSSSARSCWCSRVFGVIYRKAAPGWAGLAIGMVVFAAIIPVAPTTGASINPARTTGPMIVQQIMGASVSWEQWPVYVVAELLAGVAAAVAFGFIAHTAARQRQVRPLRGRCSFGGLSMKKLINRPEDVLADALKGIDAAHPELRVDHQHRVIYRARPKADGKVGLISGGGSGHEPLHGGFVGPGMLDAACCGEVFTSPTPGPDAVRRPPSSTAGPACCTS